MSALAGSFKNPTSESETTFHFVPPWTWLVIDPDWSRRKYISRGTRSPSRTSPEHAASGSSPASVLPGITLIGPVLPPEPPAPGVAPVLSPLVIPPMPPLPVVGVRYDGSSDAEQPAIHTTPSTSAAGPEKREPNPL